MADEKPVGFDPSNILLDDSQAPGHDVGCLMDYSDQRDSIISTMKTENLLEVMAPNVQSDNINPFDHALNTFHKPLLPVFDTHQFEASPSIQPDHNVQMSRAQTFSMKSNSSQVPSFPYTIRKSSQASTYSPLPFESMPAHIKIRLAPVPAVIKSQFLHLPTRKWVDRNIFVDIPVVDLLSEALNKTFTGPYTSIKPVRKMMTIEEALLQAENEQSLGDDKVDAYLLLYLSRSFRSIAQLAKNDLISCDPLNIPAIMRFWYLRWTSMLRLGHFKLIKVEWEKLKIASIVNGQNLMFYELYASSFGDQNGPMISFELEVFICCIPCFTGNHHDGIHNLYLLLFPRPDHKSRNLTVIQRTRIAIQIINVLLNMDGNLILAIECLKSLSIHFGEDVDIWSAIGRLFLQVGDVVQAAIIFKRVEGFLGISTDVLPIDYSRYDLVLSNRAYLLMADGRFSEALGPLLELISKSPSDITAVNNLAVCQLHAGNVGQASSFLESIVIDYPRHAATDERLIFNLASMFDLGELTMDKKRRIMKIVGNNAGDDFDADCFKL